MPPCPKAVDHHGHLLLLDGLGCDAATVVNILAHRNVTKRALIQQEYRTMYSGDLLKRLESELTGKLETAVFMWMHDPTRRNAMVIQMFKQHCYSKFGVHLKHDIEKQTSGDHKKLLLKYVEQDANALFKAGEKRLGTDEKTFIQIFIERSRAPLAAINSAYHNMYGNSLKKAMKSETSGCFEHGILTILQSSQNTTMYFFAKVLHKAMKGLGTNDTTLIRVIVTRTEIDMQYIKTEYHKKYKKTLNDAVHSETSGYYRTFLLSLLGPNH
ncbi:hypothetical protein EUGRSUZ_L01717 [Eucalyptus grandis]|uniref:Annexin n=1 Tax=Eucalyptus grandis TaxID=71139 RepID=A0A058ZSE3_EUCGR|nr:hypothetical protein EUGRSUZ_L01717 [Eucalyptus grandis]